MKADVVVANIPGPLRELAPLISVLPVSGGLLAFPVFWQARRERLRSLCRQLRSGPGRGKKKSGAALPVVN